MQDDNGLVDLEGAFSPFGLHCTEIEANIFDSRENFEDWASESSELNFLIWAQPPPDNLEDCNVELSAFAFDTHAASVNLAVFLEKSFETSRGAGPALEKIALEKLRLTVDKLISAREAELGA